MPGGVEGGPGGVGVARLEHQLAVGVLGDPDDPGDVHAALRERGGHARERAGSIVELDREPDRHAATSCVGRWYPAARRPRLRSGHAAPRPPATPRASRSSATIATTGTRAAVRFFKERRIAIHQVDLTRKPIAPRRAPPVRRTARAPGARRRDVTGVARRRPRLSPDGRPRDRRAAARDPSLLRLPLVRFGNDVAAGRDEATWKRWVSSASRAAT